MKKKRPTTIGNMSIETNLLIQQHSAYTKVLESQRRTYRQKTQLKTWPLQDMALEHYQHLAFG